MATTNPTARLRLGVRILGLRVSLAVLVNGTTLLLRVRLCLRHKVVVHLALAFRNRARGGF